jgi:hypothetical protein
MRRSAAVTFLALLWAAAVLGAEAVNDEEKKDGEVTVQLKDGSTATGTLVREEEAEPPVRDDTRLFLAPTGRPLRRGSGYFSDHWIFFPGLAYGVTGNVTVAGGVSIIPGVDLDEQAMYFTPKIGARLSDRAAVSVGGLLARVGDEDDTLKIGYVVTTLGSPDHSVTAGLGFGRAGEGDTAPMLMIGGSTRLSKRLSLMTENWIFPDGDFELISGGLRFRGGRLTVDLAVLTSPEAFEDLDGLPLVPWLSFSYHFGAAK